MIVLAVLTAHADDREPSEEQLQHATMQFNRTYAAALKLGKVWEGTQHILDENFEDVGYVHAVKFGGGLQERWVTWDGGTALYSIPGKMFTVRHEPGTGDWKWNQIVDALPAGEHPLTEMTIEYKLLTSAELDAVANLSVPIANKTLYRLEQFLTNANGSPSGLEVPGQPSVDGWLLRVYSNGVWQDHWTFRNTFEPDKIEDIYPVWQLTPTSSAFIGSNAGVFYDYAEDNGATWWAFVEHHPAGEVIVP